MAGKVRAEEFDGCRRVSGAFGNLPQDVEPRDLCFNKPPSANQLRLHPYFPVDISFVSTLLVQ